VTRLDAALMGAQAASVQHIRHPVPR
jgi:hypothetical protein